MNFAKSNGNRRVRRAAAGLAILLGVGLAGCEPQLNPEQYGQVIYKLPQIEGIDRPYPLPELEEPAPKSPTEVIQVDK